jgi:hypothetical protein
VPALGVDDEPDIDLVLGVARVAAHEVERRAAPVTTFLLGIAVGRALDPRRAERDGAAGIRALAQEWTTP